MLAGRDAERRTIETLLAAARVAESRSLVLSGEPGVGKTSLLGFAAEAAPEMRVLRAQGVESEQHVPFAGLLQVLRPVLDHLGDLPAPQSAALESALALRPALPGGPSRFAVGAATLGLLTRAAEDRPLVVLVDDGHLVDAPSVEALVFAARRMLSDAVALLVAVRSTEPGAAAWEPLPQLPLEGLDLAAAEALLSTASEPVRRDELVRLHEATAGNPLALLELRDRLPRLDGALSASPVTVPERLARSFLRQVEGLSPETRTALLVAAADGTGLRAVDAACRTLGVTAAALDEAQDAGLVRVEGDAVTFRHPLVRSAVYGAADGPRRREVHRALARAVPVSEVHRLAWHLSAGAVPPDDVTARTLESVAAQASVRGAHATAADAYARSAELTAELRAVGPRLAAAGEAAWLAGRTAAAAEQLAKAAASELPTTLRTHVHEVRGAVETRAGSLTAALDGLTAAAHEIADVDPAGAVRLLADAVHVSFYLLDPAPAVRAADEISRLAPHVGDEATASLAVLATGMAKVMSGAGAEGVALLRETAYRLATRAAEPSDQRSDPFRLPLRVQGALWLRDADPDRGVVAAAVEEMRAAAALGSIPYLLMQVGRDAATTDRWADAEAAYLEAARLARETGQTTDLAVSLAGLALVEARRGRTGGLTRCVQEALPLAHGNAVRLAEAWLLFAQGDAAAVAGDPALAGEHYEALERMLASTAFADPDQSCAPELVEGYVQQGRLDDAQAVAASLATKAEAKGTGWSLARSARATALCSSDPEPAYRTALEHHARTPDRYETARTELAYGAWLRRDRRRVEARPVLRSALDTFELLGAEPWAERATQELQATGETVVRRDADERESLTPQERQVALLLAEGRTTRQAAAALFLSPKTVEYHLRHVYLKLGIRSRPELTERIRG